jgi:hypothetical protein
MISLGYTVLPYLQIGIQWQATPSLDVEVAQGILGLNLDVIIVLIDLQPRGLCLLLGVWFAARPIVNFVVNV